MDGMIICQIEKTVLGTTIAHQKSTKNVPTENFSMLLLEHLNASLLNIAEVSLKIINKLF